MEVDGQGHELGQLIRAEGEEIRFVATRDHQGVTRTQRIGVWKRDHQIAARRQLAPANAFAKGAGIGLHPFKARAVVNLAVDASGKIGA